MNESEAQSIFEELRAYDPPKRLRTAADLLDIAAKQGGNERLTRIAHSVIEMTANELGAALALHALRKRAAP